MFTLNAHCWPLQTILTKYILVSTSRRDWVNAKNKQHQQSENTSPEPAMRSTERGSKSLTRRRWTLKEKSRRPSISDARTLNGDGGFELPAIFNHLLSRDYKFTRQPGAFIAHEGDTVESYKKKIWVFETRIYFVTMFKLTKAVCRCSFLFFFILTYFTSLP